MGVVEFVCGVEVDVVERDEDALEGDGEIGGDVMLCLCVVCGEILWWKCDGGVCCVCGECELCCIEMFDVYE